MSQDQHNRLSPNSHITPLLEVLSTTADASKLPSCYPAYDGAPTSSSLIAQVLPLHGGGGVAVGGNDNTVYGAAYVGNVSRSRCEDESLAYPCRDGVGCVAIQPSSTATVRTPIPLEVSTAYPASDVETRFRSGSAWVAEGLHHLSALLHSKAQSDSTHAQQQHHSDLQEFPENSDYMSFNSRSARKKLHLSSSGGGGVTVATVWDQDQLATLDSTTNTMSPHTRVSEDGTSCGATTILIPEESRQRLAVGYSSSLLATSSNVVSGSTITLLLAQHAVFIPSELYVGNISMLGDGSAVSRGSTNGLAWADRSKVRFLQFGTGCLVVLPSNSSTIFGINLQEEARRHFFEGRLKEAQNSSSGANIKTDDRSKSSPPWWESFAAQIFASPSVVEHHIDGRASGSSQSNLRRIPVDAMASPTSPSDSQKPKPMSYLGEWQCGQRHGFGIEVDLSAEGSQGIGSAAVVGGGQSEKIFPLSSGGSTGSTRRSGILGASHDCPCCSRFRSRGPLFDLSMSSHTHQHSSPLFCAKTPASEPSSCVKYVGPFSMDAREGSGTLYHYPPNLSSSIPSFSVSALWKDGQLMEPGSNTALKFSRRTTNKEEMKNWRGSLSASGGATAAAARTRVLQASNASPMEVRLLDSGYILNGTNWDFDTLEFDSLTITPPNTSIAMIPKAAFGTTTTTTTSSNSASYTSTAVQSPTGKNGLSGSNQPPPLTIQEQAQRDLIVATTAAATVFAASSTMSRSTMHANLPRHVDGLWEGLFAALDAHLSTTTTEMMLKASIADASSAPATSNDDSSPASPLEPLTTIGNHYRTSSAASGQYPPRHISHSVWVSSPRARLWSAMLSVVDKGPFQTMLCSFQQLLMSSHQLATGTLEDPPSLADPLRHSSVTKQARYLSSGDSFINADRSPSLSAWSGVLPSNICPAAGGADIAAIPSHKALAGMVSTLSSFETTIPPNVLTPPFLNQNAPLLPRPGGTSSLRQPPPPVTTAMFLRACDDVTSFVASMRFRLMSVLAANPTLPSLLSADVTVKADPSNRDVSVVDSVLALLELVELRKKNWGGGDSDAKGGSPVVSLLNHILDELDGTSIPDLQGGGSANGGLSVPTSASYRMGASYDTVDGPQSPLSNTSSHDSPYSSSITGFRARRQHFQQRPRGQSMSTLMNSSSLDVADEVLYFTWDYVYPLTAPVLEDSCRQLSDVKCWAADVALTVQRLQKNPTPKGLFDGGKLSKSSYKSPIGVDGLNDDNQSNIPTSWEDAVPPTSRAYMKLEQNYSKLINHISSKAFNYHGKVSSSSMSPFQRAAVHAVNAIFLHRNATTNVSAYTTHVPQPTAVNSASRVTDNGRLLFSPREQLDTRTTLSVALNDTVDSTEHGVRGDGDADATPSLSSLLVTLHELYAAVCDECLRAATKHYDSTDGKSTKKKLQSTYENAVDRGDIAAKLLVCREWSTYLVRGTMPLVCTQLIMRAATLSTQPSNTPSNLDVYAASETFLSRIITLQEIVRKGLLASVTASAGTSLACAYSTPSSNCVPHIYRYEGYVCGGPSEVDGGADSKISLGISYAYDDPVSTSIVSVYIEALEAARGRCAEDNAGNIKAFLPQLPQPVASCVSAVAIGSPVVSALLAVKAEAEAAIQVVNATKAYLGEAEVNKDASIAAQKVTNKDASRQQALSSVANSVLDHARAFTTYSKALIAAKLLVDPLLPSSTQIGSFAGSPIAKLCEQEGFPPPGGRAPSIAPPIFTSQSPHPRRARSLAPPPASSTATAASSGFSQTAIDLANTLIREEMGWEDTSERRSHIVSLLLEDGGSTWGGSPAPSPLPHRNGGASPLVVGGDGGTSLRCPSTVPTITVSGAKGILSPTNDAVGKYILPRSQLVERMVNVIATTLHQQHQDQAVIGNQHCNNTGVAADTISCTAPQWMNPFVAEIQPLPVYISTLIVPPPFCSISAIIRDDANHHIEYYGTDEEKPSQKPHMPHVLEDALKRLLSQEPSQLLSSETYNKRVERLRLLPYPLIVQLLHRYANEPSPLSSASRGGAGSTKTTTTTSSRNPSTTTVLMMPSAPDSDGVIASKVSAFLGALDTLVDILPLRPNTLITASSLSVSTLWSLMGHLSNRKSNDQTGNEKGTVVPILPADSYLPSSKPTSKTISTSTLFVSAEGAKATKRHDMLLSNAEMKREYIPVVMVEAVHDQISPKLRARCANTQTVNTFLSTLRWQAPLPAVMNHVHITIPGAPSASITSNSSSLSTCLISTGTQHTDLSAWSNACASVAALGPSRGLMSSPVDGLGCWGIVYHLFAYRAKKKLKALRPTARQTLLKSIKARGGGVENGGVGPSRLLFNHLLSLELEQSGIETFMLRGPASLLRSQLASNLSTTMSRLSDNTSLKHNNNNPNTNAENEVGDDYRIAPLNKKFPSYLLRSATQSSSPTSTESRDCIVFGGGSTTSSRLATGDRTLRALLGVGIDIDVDSSVELGSVGQTLQMYSRQPDNKNETIPISSSGQSLEGNSKDDGVCDRSSSDDSGDDLQDISGRLQVVKLRIVDDHKGKAFVTTTSPSACGGALDRATAKAFANSLLDGVQRDHTDRREGVDVGGGAGGR